MQGLGSRARWDKGQEKRTENRAKEQGARQKEVLRPDKGRATQMGKRNGHCKQTVR
jgi:hypothetical protein